MKKIIKDIFLFSVTGFIFLFVIIPLSFVLKILNIDILKLNKRNINTYWIEKKKEIDMDKQW